MKILCTFSGKFGDILFSLATVRSITELKENFSYEEVVDNKAKVDFACMPQYESLLPLLNAQSYIDKAFVIKEWILKGSPHGDQPWQSPDFEGREQYDKVIDLGYKQHPGRDEPLIDFIARQQGIALKDPIPFLSVDSEQASNVISYAFNDSMMDLKEKQLNYLKERLEPEFTFRDTSKMPWLEAAKVINSSICFIGCRSSNYVLASGLGKRIFIYEPNFARSKYGPWGTTFTNPHGKEEEIVYTDSTIEEIKMLKKEEVVKCK